MTITVNDLYYLFENFRNQIDEEELVESRLTDLQAKYPNIKDEIKALSVGDPSGNNKYLGWMVKQYIEGRKVNPNHSYLDEYIIDLVKKFHQNIPRLKEKDLNKYTAGQLESTLEDLGQSKHSLKKKEREQAIEGATVLYDDDNFSIIRPDSTKASCHYGNKNTSWCIAAKGHSNYFDSYTSKGRVFYFLKNKNLDPYDPHERTGHSGYMIAFVFNGTELEEFYDSPDNEIAKNTVIKHIQENLMKSSDGETYFAAAGEKYYNKLVSLMKDHVEENPPSTANREAEYENILANFRSNNPEHVDLMYEWDDEYPWFRGSLWIYLPNSLEWKIDVDKYFDYRNYESKRQFIDLVSKAVDKHSHIYPEEIEIDDDTPPDGDDRIRIMIDFNSEGSEPSDMQYLAEELLRTDQRFDEIYETLIDLMEEAGFIKGGPTEKAGEYFRRLPDFKHVEVELVGKEIKIFVPLEIRGNDIGNIYLRIKNDIVDIFKFNIARLLDDAKTYATKQLSLMERLLPQYVPNFILQHDEFSENEVKLDMIFTIIWNDNEEKFQMISNFAQYIDEHYHLVQDIFIKSVREVFNKDSQ